MNELSEELKLELQNYNQEKLNEEFVNACDFGDLDMVRYLLTSPELKDHADIHTQNDLGFRWACSYGHLELVKYLLASSELIVHANIHAKNDYAFNWACVKEQWTIVKYLLNFSGEQYIDFQKNAHNLDWAISENHHDIVESMIISLYKNDRFSYIDNISKVEKYCEKHALNVETWKDKMMKEAIMVNPKEEALFI